MNQVINITRTAGKKLLEMSKSHNTKSILFSIEGKGCNGYGYKFTPIYTKSDPLNEIVLFEDINIVVCRSSIFYVLGTTIDYKTDIMGSTFQFDNPNATSKCGCGTSFSTDKK